MNIKTTIIITLGLTILFIISCDRETIVENKLDNSIQNQFPINYVGDKILEFNKPIIQPKGGPPISQDTFALYSISNAGIDTVWIETVPNIDTSNGYFKDKSIKKVYKQNIFFYLLKENKWTGTTESNGCWGGCNDSVKLLPNEKLYFIDRKGRADNDSNKFDITVKIKKGAIIKDSIITKKLILKNNHFIEDTKYWKSIEKR